LRPENAGCGRQAKSVVRFDRVVLLQSFRPSYSSVFHHDSIPFGDVQAITSVALSVNVHPELLIFPNTSRCTSTTGVKKTEV
jgi:hypothetical protein